MNISFWELRDFAGVTLQRDEGYKNIGFHSPHVSSRIALYADKLYFPLKERYDKANATIEGVDTSATDAGGESGRVAAEESSDPQPEAGTAFVEEKPSC